MCPNFDAGVRIWGLEGGHFVDLTTVIKELGDQDVVAVSLEEKVYLDVYQHVDLFMWRSRDGRMF